MLLHAPCDIILKGDQEKQTAGKQSKNRNKMSNIEETNYMCNVQLTGKYSITISTPRILLKHGMKNKELDNDITFIHTILASSFSASAILLVSLESTTNISPCVFW